MLLVSLINLGFKSFYKRNCTLTYKLYVADNTSIKSPIVIIHGLFGSKENWQSLSKEISKICQRDVYAIDLPNHGNSLHSDKLNSVYDISMFVKNFLISKLNLSNFILIGHSLGGKICMQMALNNSKNSEKIDKLVVVDIAPIGKSDSHDQTKKYLNIIKEINLCEKEYNINNLGELRRAIDNKLKDSIPDINIRQFLLSSLYKDQDLKYKWKFNLSNLHTLLDNFELKLKPGAKFNKDTLFLCGSLSNYVLPDNHKVIKDLFPQAKIEYIQGAGHWVHIDKPYLFLEKIKIFVNTT